MSGNEDSVKPGRALTGVAGLDELLYGGLLRHKMYLIEGEPGVGKTTLGIHFAMQGAAEGERVLYIVMSETEAETVEIAKSHGWSLEGIEFVFYGHREFLHQTAQQTMLHPAEVELPEATEPIVERIEQFKPERLVLDSLSEFRLLAQDERFFRRQILALKEYLADRGCTTLMLDARGKKSTDVTVHSIASGIVEMEQFAPKFGPSRRRLQIRKVRGMNYTSGYHDYAVRTGGLQVFPRLIAARHRDNFDQGSASSGNARLDALVGGGLDYGTSTVLMGPAGVGKSNVALQYVVAAAERGSSSAVYAFDERVPTVLQRAQGIGLDLDAHLEAGTIKLQQIDPGEMTSGEFSNMVRQDASDGRRLIVVDSLSGYFHSMPEEHFLLLHIHELLSFLSQQGVVTLMVVAQHGVLGTHLQPMIDVSYVADTVLMLRYFEHAGEIRQAISTFKRRSGTHERFVRELRITSEGIWIGEPLRHFEGILSGIPEFTGSPAKDERA